jgi:hypothetical protein
MSDIFLLGHNLRLEVYRIIHFLPRVSKKGAVKKVRKKGWHKRII